MVDILIDRLNFVILQNEETEYGRCANQTFALFETTVRRLS
jgi:hypothetical protein